MVTLGLWGPHTLALRIPSHIVKAASLRPGQTATCRLMDDGSILVRLASTAAQERAAVTGSATEPSNQQLQRKMTW